MLQKLRAVRPARLSAIEIAEGALLADIAVVFQLLSIYLPIGGGYPALMVPIPFAFLLDPAGCDLLRFSAVWRYYAR